MIPWILIAQLISRSEFSLSHLINDRYLTFPSSGEINFSVHNANKIVNMVLVKYKNEALSIDRSDGISIEFKDWRLNIRCSNTEPLIRLNMESKRSTQLLKQKYEEVSMLLKSEKNEK